MIKAIAIDDEPPALQVIKSFCARIDYLDLQHTFTRTSDAKAYISNSQIDLLFLDINMPSVNGIDFYKSLSLHAMVIFTTAYSEYAVEGFNLNAIDYLLKPFTFQRFSIAAQKANEYINFKQQPAGQKQEYIFLRIDYSMMKLRLDNILFIEGLDDYLKIRLKTQKNLVVRMTLKALLDQLPQTEFIRVHRSYIVPLSEIETVRNKIIFIGDDEIPVGKSYEESFFSVFKMR